MCLFPDFGQPEFPEMCLFRILANSPSLARLNLQSSRCVAENNVPDNKSGMRKEKLRKKSFQGILFFYIEIK